MMVIVWQLPLTNGTYQKTLQMKEDCFKSGNEYKKCGVVNEFTVS